ncbi:MAG: ribosome small subunit-dependent GTPase A [Proteobacteria bacterium]|nr:ribosome small subunit-dependent GTPase A [Pseudomonadota bacterium]
MHSIDEPARLAAIGWRGDAWEMPAGKRLARVIAQHRNGYRVHDGTSECTAQPAPRFLRRDVDPAERPAVGDFVVLAMTTTPAIEEIVPRRSLLVRAAAGERHRRQVIAANVDTVFVLMGLDGDFNPRRIERYLVLIEGSGARPVVVLTKIDKVENAASTALRAELHAAIPQVETLAINAKDAASVAALLKYLQAGDTAVLVGSSGAGKSTLTNTLLGVERHATAAVRGHDSRGRHTTTHRALVQLASGGCLIDTPGMREIKFTGDEELATAASFADIEALALDCRFGDCAHVGEPGCAVRAALESGTLDAARWQAWLKLRGEVAAAGDTLEAQLRRKSAARVANKALGKRLAEKYGRN